jgi:hypothetical protein
MTMTKQEWDTMLQTLQHMGFRILSHDLSTETIFNKAIADKIDHEHVKFVTDVWQVLDGAGNLLIKKHKDYGPTNISRSPGGPLNGLRVRMWDKTARINHLIDSGATPENESLRDSFIDLLNYSAIALMVIDGKWPND